jgi:hypothetical protein
MWQKALLMKMIPTLSSFLPITDNNNNNSYLLYIQVSYKANNKSRKKCLPARACSSGLMFLEWLICC